MSDNEADLALIVAISESDQSAMTRFYKAHEARTYAFVLKKLNDPHAAADVVVETMMAVWNNAKLFRGSAKVTTWLLGIAHRKAIDVLRKRGRHEADELDFDVVDESSDFTLALESADDSANIKHCMEGLSDSQKEIIHLAFFEDMAYPEVAEVVDCPEGTVKTRVFHAKKKLKQCLERLMRG